MRYRQFFYKEKEVKDLNEWNFYEKGKIKALEILLKCEKSVAEINKFFPKRFKNDINEDQKSILFNALKLFDIRKKIFSLFSNGSIIPLDCQSAAKSEPKIKSEESIAERTKLRRQRFNEIARNENTIILELFRKYFKHSSPNDMHKALTEARKTWKKIGLKQIQLKIAQLI